MSDNYGQRHEAWSESKNGERNPLSILSFARDGKRLHPTQKPVGLLEYLIRTYTNPGAVVLDNCIAEIFDTLWIANWGSNDGKPDGITLKSAAYTDKIDLHQFTSNGYTKVPGAPGINHRIDLNRLTGKRPLSWFTGRNYGEQTVTESAPIVEQTYVVQANDTLWGIAKKFLGAGAKYPEIMSLNGLTSTVIRTGMILKIPV